MTRILLFRYSQVLLKAILKSKIYPNEFQLLKCGRKQMSTVTKSNLDISKYLQLFEFQGPWPESEQEDFLKHMRIIPDFITPEEESKLIEEVDPYMKRLHYEFDHWDDAIHGFRETERKHWYPHNRTIIERIRSTAFEDEIMQYVHVLDLAEKGVIKPHVDSTRYCGTTISGISLLSDAVMRLVRTDEKKYQQHRNADAGSNYENEENYRSQPATQLENNFYVNVLLNRRSLYIMNHTARYNFTHEILACEESVFKGLPINKGRRISIICRNEPQ